MNLVVEASAAEIGLGSPSQLVVLSMIACSHPMVALGGDAMHVEEAVVGDLVTLHRYHGLEHEAV